MKSVVGRKTGRGWKVEREAERKKRETKRKTERG